MANDQAANAAALLVGGSGLTTIVLSSMNAGLFPVEAVGLLGPVAFVLGELVQTIAGASEYCGELAARRGMVPAL